MSTSKLVHCREDPLELLENLWRKDSDNYANDTIVGQAYCPNGISRKVIIITQEKERKEILKPALCDCNTVRVALTLKIAVCRKSQRCLVREVLFKGLSLDELVT